MSIKARFIPVVLLAAPFLLSACDDNGAGPGKPGGVACTDYGLSPHVTGSYRTDASSVTIVGTLAYVAGRDSLLIFDISGSGDPELVGAAELACHGDVAVAGNYAYVGAGNGVRVVDVTTPSAPALLGEIPTPNLTGPVVISGSYVYTGDWSGVRIMDISDPSQPVIVENIELEGGGSGIAVQGNHAFICSINGPNYPPYSGAMFSVDVSNPSSAAMVDTIFSLSAVDVAIDGSFAYVARYGGSLEVIDISNPGSMMSWGDVDLHSLAVGIDVSGGLAYVANNAVGVTIVDVTNPSGPAIVGGVDPGGYTRELAVSGNRVYLAQGATDGWPYFHCVDASNPATGAVGKVSGNSGEYDGPVQIVGGTAYTTRAGMLDIIDISEPRSPWVLGTFVTSSLRDIAVVGNRAYLISSNTGFDVVNVATPSNPVSAGHLDFVYAGQGLSVQGSYAHVAADDGLHVIDIDGYPQFVGYVDTPGVPKDAAVGGDLVFVADGALGVQVVDVSTPTSPTIVGHLDTPAAPLRIVVDGAYIYVLVGNEGLLVATRSAQPAIISQLDTPAHAQDITFFGSTAYVADNLSVQVIDRSNVNNLSIIGTAVLRGGGSFAVGAASNNVVWVGAGDEGLVGIPVQCP